MTVQQDIKKIEQHAGDYILLGGMGLMNGLAYACKYDAHKIIGVDDDGLVLQRYGRRKRSILPWHNMEQQYRIISKAEYKGLPTY